MELIIVLIITIILIIAVIVILCKPTYRKKAKEFFGTINSFLNNYNKPGTPIGFYAKAYAEMEKVKAEAEIAEAFKKLEALRKKISEEQDKEISKEEFLEMIRKGEI